MSKVSIWCRYDDAKGIKGFEVWSGEMEHIPSEGDGLEIFDGWGVKRVLSTCYGVHNGTVTLEVDADYTGEYAAKASKQSLT